MTGLDDRHLAHQLRALGVGDRDTMVHASLRRLGLVHSDASHLVAALDDVVGGSGHTWLMVLGARDDHDWVNERPEAERESLLASATPFDPAVTPAEVDMGMLAEVMRRTPGTRVSDHPEGRVGARGPAATAYVDDVPWDDYYGPGSPLERLVERGGQVLRLGADLDTVTVLHYAEYLADIPAKRRVSRLRRVAGPQGSELRWVQCLDDCDGIVDRPGEEDYFATIVRTYLAQGRGRTGTVEGATSELLDAGDLVAFGAEWMTTHLCP